MVTRTIGSFGSIVLFAVLAGCQNSHPADSSVASTPARSVIIATGNGGHTTVFVPTANPTQPAVYCSEGTQACPECTAAAVKYFQTGVLDPQCSRTGAIRSVDTRFEHQ
jgi:hypothetical protein